MDFMQHLAKELEKDFELLNELEEKLRSEDNPRRKRGLENDIQEIRQKISSRESELARLKISDWDIPTLVEQVRKQIYTKVKHDCGTLRILHVSRPIELDDLYIDVNILNEPNSYRYQDFSHYLKSDEFNRWGFSAIPQKRIPGLEAVEIHKKLILLGKPGSGKSTFLQYLAIRCNEGEIQSDKVPIFIRLKEFAEYGKKNEYSLLNYINQKLNECNFSEWLLTEVTKTLLQQGSMMILLDGLDEPSDDEGYQVVREIDQFCSKYYRNSFIITCRIAAKEYRFWDFAYIEISDFNQEQIEGFVRKWFITVACLSKNESSLKSLQFIDKLNQDENRQIRELMTTPILLNLTCLVFQERVDFPSGRAQLYEEGLDILFRLWDAARGIQRSQINQDISFQRKKEILWQIAAVFFIKNLYFFEKKELKKLIYKSLYRIYDQLNSAEIWDISEAFLNSIEAQYGLLVERARGTYSFSHLTFQEYFTAQACITRLNSEIGKKLINGITDKRWREVCLLAAETRQNTDQLVQHMKQRIDEFLSLEDTLQNVLALVNQRALLAKSMAVDFRLAAMRAHYLARNHNLEQDLACALDHALSVKLNSLLSPEDLLEKAYLLEKKLGEIRDSSFIQNELENNESLYSIRGSLKILINVIRYSPNHSFDIQLQILICEYNNHFPYKFVNIETLQTWWRNGGQLMTENLLSIIEDNVNIRNRLQTGELYLTEMEKLLLKEYYDANKLLLSCIKLGNVSPSIHQQIEDTLLLPIANIRKLQADGVIEALVSSPLA